MVRWCSKVAEMKAMGTPGWGKFFSEKNLVGKYFFELDFAGDPSILGEIPFVKDSQFKWKIEGSRTKSSSEKNSRRDFFWKKLPQHRPYHSFHFRYFRASTDVCGENSVTFNP